MVTLKGLVDLSLECFWICNQFIEFVQEFVPLMGSLCHCCDFQKTEKTESVGKALNSPMLCVIYLL